jgi:hypothetical protein
MSSWKFSRGQSVTICSRSSKSALAETNQLFRPTDYLGCVFAIEMMDAIYQLFAS